MKEQGLPAKNDQQAFERLFTEWFGKLHTYAFSVLGNESRAEETVQTVFCRLWERKEQLQIHTSWKAYLYGSVYHECMDGFRREKNRRRYRAFLLHSSTEAAAETATGRMELSELEMRLRQALDELPEKCRGIFQLSRFGELKYREIAELLDISTKTVEAQMTKALKHLRKRLIDFL